MTFISNPELLDPAAGSATLHCYSRVYLVYLSSCSVTAVDGHRTTAREVFSLTTRLAPGTRWVEFQTQNYFGGSGGTSEVCAFTADFQEGREYQIKAHSLGLDPVPAGNPDLLPLQTGKIVVQSKASGGALDEVTVPVTCSHGGGSLCRSTSDCAASRSIGCVPQGSHAFGRCETVLPKMN
jgi:hypothetical protein